jgi:hypothetical protein
MVTTSLRASPIDVLAPDDSPGDGRGPAHPAIRLVTEVLLGWCTTPTNVAKPAGSSDPLVADKPIRVAPLPIGRHQKKESASTELMIP